MESDFMETLEHLTPKPFTKKKFGECALELGFLTAEQVENVTAMQQEISSSRRIGHIFAQQGLLDSEQVAQIVAMQFSLDYVKLDHVAPELVNMVPPALMTRHRFLPYRLTSDTFTIAMFKPRNMIRIVDELELLLDMEIALVVASEDRIEKFLKELEISQNIMGAISDDLCLPGITADESADDILSLENITAEENPTIKLINTTILDAINKRASDIHIESSETGVIIRYRIDGMLYQATDSLDIQHQSPMISRIKVMSELDISEKRIPQDGRFKIKLRDRYIDFRVSILPTIYGEDAVLRILDRKGAADGAKDFTLDAMDLPSNEIKRLKRVIHAPYGMFLMTGPTGSGKTTTLYRALSEVRSNDVKIITIEDPVEYQLKGIVQIQVNEKKGLTFARGLRSILRHDPDKILVGEIRDAETARIAIQSALTGHLVFTTVHANRSFEVINRFTHMDIKSFDLMSALNCVAAQRLIRTLCACKESALIPPEELITSGLDPDQCGRISFYQPKGCDRCKGTGFKGRKAIIELLELDDEMREMVNQQISVKHIKKKAADSGTIFLRQAALAEVLRGRTPLEEANRITFVESQKDAEIKLDTQNILKRIREKDCSPDENSVLANSVAPDRDGGLKNLYQNGAD